MLPPTITVLERGWLSSNTIVGIAGDAAAAIDSGYATHAPQTVALLRHALDGRRLEQLINTHTHSDHIGGNAALQAAFGCRILIPEGEALTVAGWDQTALLLTPLAQQAPRFAADATLADGDRFAFADLEWHALAVPGHDMDAIAFHCPQRRLLISGDALWHDGFGVVFAELLGDPDGLAATRRTLDRLSGLAIDVVIPGHGPAFADVDVAFANAYARLAGFEANRDRLARHALKVALVFALLERRQVRRDAVEALLASMPFCLDVNHRYLGLSLAGLADWLVADLCRAGALREDDGVLAPT